MDINGYNTQNELIIPDNLEVKELCASTKITTSKLDIGVCGAPNPLYTLPITAPGNIGRYIQSSQNRAKITLDGLTANSRFKMSNGAIGYSSVFDITFTAGVYDLEDFLTVLMVGIKSTWNARYVSCKIFITYNTGLERIEVLITSPQGVDSPGYQIGDFTPQGWGVLGLTVAPIFSSDHPGGYTFINPPTYSTAISPMIWVKYPLTVANNPQANGDSNEDVVQYTFEGDINIVGNMVCEDAVINGTIISVDQLNVEAPIVETAVGNTLSDTFNGGITTTYKNGIQQWSGIIRQPITSDWYLMNSNTKITKTTFPVGNGSLIGDKLTANGLLTCNTLLQTGDYYFTNNEHFFLAGNNLSAPASLIMNSLQTTMNLLDGANTPAIVIDASELNVMIDLQARGKLFCYNYIDTAGANEMVIKSQGNNVLYHTQVPIPFLGTGLFLCDESGVTKFRINSVASTSLNDFQLETGQMNTSAPLTIGSLNIKTLSSNGATNILHDQIGGDCLQVSQAEVSTNNNFRAAGQVQSDVGIFHAPNDLFVQSDGVSILSTDNGTNSTFIQTKDVTPTTGAIIALQENQVSISKKLNIFGDSSPGTVYGTIFRNFKEAQGPTQLNPQNFMFTALAAGSSSGTKFIPTQVFSRGSSIKIRGSGIHIGTGSVGGTDELSVVVIIGGVKVGNWDLIPLGTDPSGTKQQGWNFEAEYTLTSAPSITTDGFIGGFFLSNQDLGYDKPRIACIRPNSIGGTGLIGPLCDPIDLTTATVEVDVRFSWVTSSPSSRIDYWKGSIELLG